MASLSLILEILMAKYAFYNYEALLAASVSIVLYYICEKLIVILEIKIQISINVLHT